MALRIRLLEMLLKVHLGGGYRKSSSSGGRSGFTKGKKVVCNNWLLSLLVCATLVVYLVMGSIICKDGILALAVSVGGEDMKLAACHMLDLSRPLSQSIQWSAFAFFI